MIKIFSKTTKIVDQQTPNVSHAKCSELVDLSFNFLCLLIS